MKLKQNLILKLSIKIYLIIKNLILKLNVEKILITGVTGGIGKEIVKYLVDIIKK